MEKNNINDCTNDKCTGCGVCVVTCPKNALTMELDEYGFYTPILESELCISCGICKRYCIKFENDIKQTNLRKVECYSAINKNKKLLKQCSSGAVSEEIMLECIRQGYSVVGVEYDYGKNIAKHSICQNIDYLSRYRGSKYFQSYTLDAIKEVVKNKSKKFAIFGTPCQIYALRKYAMEQKFDNLLLIDIFCHGVPTMYLWKSYIKKFGTKFKHISFRTKDYGWHNYSLTFVDDTNRIIRSPKVNDKFYDLFFSKLCFNKACYRCDVRSTVEYCDIRLGDFWGTRFNSNYMGVSALVIRSEVGKNIIDAIKNKFEMESVKFEEVIEAQSYGKNHEINETSRYRIINSLKKNDIEESYAIYKKTLNLKKKIIKIGKNVVKRAPIKVQFKLRKKYN